MFTLRHPSTTGLIVVVVKEEKYKTRGGVLHFDLYSTLSLLPFTPSLFPFSSLGYFLRNSSNEGDTSYSRIRTSLLPSLYFRYEVSIWRVCVPVPRPTPDESRSIIKESCRPGRIPLLGRDRGRFQKSFCLRLQPMTFRRSFVCSQFRVSYVHLVTLVDDDPDSSRCPVCDH